MKSSVTKSFRKGFNELPASVRKQAVKAYKLWQKDSSHDKRSWETARL